MALGTDSAGEEQAEIRAGHLVGGCPAGVEGHVTAAEGVGFGEERVFAVAAGPFVVPYVEDGAGLGGLVGVLEESGVDLRAGGPAFTPDQFGLLCGGLLGEGCVGVGKGGEGSGF